MEFKKVMGMIWPRRIHVAPAPWLEDDRHTTISNSDGISEWRVESREMLLFWPRWPRCPLFRFPSLALLSVCKREAWWCILKANATTPLWSLDAFQQCELVSRHARWENYRGRTCHFVCERTVRRSMGFRLSTVLLPFQTIIYLKILNNQTISKFDQNYRVKHKNL